MLISAAFAQLRLLKRVFRRWNVGLDGKTGQMAPPVFAPKLEQLLIHHHSSFRHSEPIAG
jgi:hypothetical protein